MANQGTGLTARIELAAAGRSTGCSYCTDIFVDTGATQTLVRKDLVSEDDILDGEVTIRCAHGDEASYPLAAVKINIGDLLGQPEEK